MSFLPSPAWRGPALQENAEESGGGQHSSFLSEVTNRLSWSSIIVLWFCIPLNSRLVPNRKRSASRLCVVTCSLNFYAEDITRNAGLEEAQAGIKIARRNSNNLRYADVTTLMAEGEEELKSLLMLSEREEWKSWLKAQHSENKDHGIRSHHFMGNRWVNSVRPYIFGLQNHCRWWLQPWN